MGIYIFPALYIDTNISPFYCKVDTCHSSHYGHFFNTSYYGLTRYGLEYGQYLYICNDQEKNIVKAEFKNKHWFKSYGQNKIDSDSHGISKLIYILLKSLEEGEWKTHNAKFHSNFFATMRLL